MSNEQTPKLPELGIRSDREIGPKLATARTVLRGLFEQRWAELSADPRKAANLATDIYDERVVYQLEREAHQARELLEKHQMGKLLRQVRELSRVANHTCQRGQWADCGPCMADYILLDFGLEPVRRTRA